MKLIKTEKRNMKSIIIKLLQQIKKLQLGQNIPWGDHEPSLKGQ